MNNDGLIAQLLTSGSKNVEHLAIVVANLMKEVEKQKIAILKIEAHMDWPRGTFYHD